MYRPLYSAFVVIMLATPVDDKNQTKPNQIKQNKTKKTNQAWSLLTIINWKNLLCYWTYMYIFVDFIHFPECAYLAIGKSL